MSAYTFKPTVNSTKPNVPKKKPIYNRIDEITRMKQEKISGLRKSVEGLSGCTFKPETNENRKSVGGGGGGDNNDNDNNLSLLSNSEDDGSSVASNKISAGQRLHSESARTAERMIARKEKREEEMKEENTFAPKLCDGSDNLGKKVVETKGGFMQRQRAWETEQEKKRQEKEFEHDKTMRGYFKPKIGKSEKVRRRNGRFSTPFERVG